MSWAAASGIISGGTNLVGSALQYHLARKNLSQQKDLATNAYKYATADMRRAGLNPVLAATGGLKPATASGGTAIPNLQGINAAEILQTVNSAKKLKADAGLSDAQAETEKVRQELLQNQSGLTVYQTNEIMNRLKNVEAEFGRINAQTNLLRQQGRVAEAEATLAGQQQKLIERLESQIGSISGIAPGAAKFAADLLKIFMSSKLRSK